MPWYRCARAKHGPAIPTLTTAASTTRGLDMITLSLAHSGTGEQFLGDATTISRESCRYNLSDRLSSTAKNPVSRATRGGPMRPLHRTALAAAIAILAG